MIGYAKEDNSCTLGVTDHLQWKDVGDHLNSLQEKLNSYLNYIASGEAKKYCEPNQVDIFRILIYFKHPLPEHAKHFIHKFQTQVARLGDKVKIETKVDTSL
jgi:hypothetical protein